MLTMVSDENLVPLVKNVPFLESCSWSQAGYLQLLLLLMSCKFQSPPQMTCANKAWNML